MRYAIGVHKGLRYKSTMWREFDFTTSTRRGPYLIKTQTHRVESVVANGLCWTWHVVSIAWRVPQHIIRVASRMP